MHAETAYLFRHALVRDAAYQLQTPTGRAQLHELAFGLIEQAFGGRPAAPVEGQPLNDAPSHGTDAIAEELVLHASLSPQPDRRGLASPVLLYTWRAALTADRQFRLTHAAALWRQLAGKLVGTRHGEALRLAGVAAHRAGNPKLGESHLLESIQAHRDIADPAGEAASLTQLAVVRRETARPAEAEQGFTQALALNRKLGRRSAEGECLGYLAYLRLDSGRVAEAEEFAMDALTIHRETGNVRGEGVELGNLGTLYRATGRVPEAEQAYQQALEILRKLGDTRAEATLLTNLALLLVQSGRSEQARSEYARAMAMQEAIGDRLNLSITLANLGGEAHAARRIELARSY